MGQAKYKANPLLLPLAGILTGIVAGRYCAFSLVEIAPPALVFLAFAKVAGGGVRRFAIGAAAIAMGILLSLLHAPGAPPVLSVPDQQLTLIEGCVVEPGVLASDREKFVVELAKGARAQVSLYVKEGHDSPALPYGSLVEITGKIRSPHNYNNPGSFDFVNYLHHQQIFWNISGNADAVKILPGTCGNFLSRWLFAIRSGALDRLDRLYAGDAYTDAMMQAVLFGATAKLDRMWTEDYRTTGTFHALVISGSHVAVLAAVLLFFLRMLGVPAGIAATAAIAVAWLYSGVTGWQAPVVRSAAGMTVFGIGRIFYREGRLLNVLAGVAICFVLLDPDQLFDASFQLSFFSVALIGAFVVPATEKTSAPLRARHGTPDGRKGRLPPGAECGPVPAGDAAAGQNTCPVRSAGKGSRLAGIVHASPCCSSSGNWC